MTPLGKGCFVRVGRQVASGAVVYTAQRVSLVLCGQARLLPGAWDLQNGVL